MGPKIDNLNAVNSPILAGGATAVALDDVTLVGSQVTQRPVVVTEYTSKFQGQHVSFWRMLRAEWLKLWTLRSTWWLVGLTIVLMAGLALMFASVLRTAINDGTAEASLEGGIVGLFGTMTGVDIITLGIQFAELTVAVLGVLLITSEYTSGMIKATFTAAPHRISVLVSKIIVLLGTTAIIGVVGVTLSWLVTRGLLNGLDNIDPISFSDPNQLRALGGAVLYLMAVAILAFGIGALVRATSAGIFAAVAVLTVIPVILNYVLMGSNAAWATNLYKFLPTVAGEQVYSFTPDEAMFARDVLGPWTGFFVLLGYGLLTVIVAAVLLRRRDA